MMKNLFRLFITSKAKEDAKEIRNYYESEQKGLGKKMRRELQEKLKMLRQHPEMCPKFLEEVRRGQLQKFPYSFYYQNDMPEKLVTVLAVYAQAKDPEQIIKDLEKRLHEIE